MIRLFIRDEVKVRKADLYFELYGKKYYYSISDDNLHIKESHEISKRNFVKVFDLLREEHKGNDVLTKRRNGSLRREWAVHNLCYNLNIKREQTADVDLNYPQTFWEKVGYGFVGAIALIFIK